MSVFDDIARTSTSPKLDTLASAQNVFPGLTLDEYTLARVINSEHGSGSPAEMTAIGDADVNKAQAAGKSIFQHVTGGSGQYGAQDAVRPVSSARSPGPRHVMAAIAVLRGPARGIAQGARRYFDPATQDKLFLKYKSGAGDKVHSCSALGLLTAWTFSRPRCGGSRCCSNGQPVASPNGSSQEEWVGPIQGIDPYQLMLMRPKTAQQDQRYAEAVHVIQSRGGYRGSEPGDGSGAVVALLGLAALSAAGVYFLRTTRIWT